MDLHIPSNDEKWTIKSLDVHEERQKNYLEDEREKAVFQILSDLHVIFDLCRLVLDYANTLNFILRAKDSKAEFRIPRYCATLSTVIKSIPNVVTHLELSYSRSVIEPLVSYLMHHKGNPGTFPNIPWRSESLLECGVDSYDVHLLSQLSWQDLGNFIMLANYLDIRCLFHISCAYVASLIKRQRLENSALILTSHKVAIDLTNSYIDSYIDLTNSYIDPYIDFGFHANTDIEMIPRDKWRLQEDQVWCDVCGNLNERFNGQISCSACGHPLFFVK